MGALIDTSILVLGERRRLDLDALIRERGDDDVFISVVTVSELLHGVYRAIDHQVRERRSRWVENVIQRFEILLIDLDTARVHAKLWAELLSQGTPVGSHDLWLAATCMTHDLSVLTANARDFDRVSGLLVERWS